MTRVVQSKFFNSAVLSDKLSTDTLQSNSGEISDLTRLKNSSAFFMAYIILNWPWEADVDATE